MQAPSLYSPVNAQGRSLTRHNPVPGRGGAGTLCDSALWGFMSHQSRTKPCLALPHTWAGSLVLLWPWDFSKWDHQVFKWESPGLGPDVSGSPELLHFLLVGFLTAAQHWG